MWNKPIADCFRCKVERTKCCSMSPILGAGVWVLMRGLIGRRSMSITRPSPHLKHRADLEEALDKRMLCARDLHIGHRLLPYPADQLESAQLYPLLPLLHLIRWSRYRTLQHLVLGLQSPQADKHFISLWCSLLGCPQIFI